MNDVATATTTTATASDANGGGGSCRQTTTTTTMLALPAACCYCYCLVPTYVDSIKAEDDVVLLEALERRGCRLDATYHHTLHARLEWGAGGGRRAVEQGVSCEVGLATGWLTTIRSLAK